MTTPRQRAMSSSSSRERAPADAFFQYRMSHIIRLRPPWELVAHSTEHPVLRRRFHCPSGLDEQDRVCLVIEGLAQLRHVTLNGLPLPFATDERGTVRRDIRACLAERNELVIELDLHGAPDPGIELARLQREVFTGGMVRLEIASNVEHSTSDIEHRM